MGKPKAPKPADPVATASAQTGMNIGTAITQQQMNNVNQVTPYGSLSYEQTGSYQYTDPQSGKVYDIPTYTATQSFSPEQQQLMDTTMQAEQNFANLAAQQSGKLGNMLSKPMDTTGLPGRGNYGAIKSPNLQRVGNGPNLQNRVANSGNIQSGFGNGGQIRSNIQGAGNVQRGFGSAGEITKSYGTDFSRDRQRVEDALMQRMNPGLDRDKQALESRLASQGIRIGSEAYQAAMDDFGRQSNDARLGAILNAGQEQSRLTGLGASRAAFENAAQAQNYGQLRDRAGFSNDAQAQQFGQNAQQAAFQNAAQSQRFGQNQAQAQFSNDAQNQRFGQNAQQAALNNQSLQQEYQNRVGAAGFNNQASTQGFNSQMALAQAQDQSRNQALQEQFALRNQPINEITALMSGSQVQNPNFVNPNTAQLANTDYAGIQSNYDNQMFNRYQSQLGSWDNMMGGVMGLGANLLMSDRRTKKDVKKVGKTDDGQNVYSFRYKAGGPIQLGLMAQEVEKKRPEAVTEVGGIKMVDYGRAV